MSRSFLESHSASSSASSPSAAGSAPSSYGSAAGASSSSSLFSAPTTLPSTSSISTWGSVCVSRSAAANSYSARLFAPLSPCVSTDALSSSSSLFSSFGSSSSSSGGGAFSSSSLSSYASSIFAVRLRSALLPVLPATDPTLLRLFFGGALLAMDDLPAVEPRLPYVETPFFFFFPFPFFFLSALRFFLMALIALRVRHMTVIRAASQKPILSVMALSESRLWSIATSPRM